MPESFDVVIVGAGAVGSAAAYHAARTARSVLLLEQFELGHTRGSSHGESRIIRHSYSSVDYATLAPAAFEAWRELERESGAKLLIMTGGIDLGRATNPALVACREALAAAAFESTWMEGEEAQAFAPQFNLPGDWAVLWQPGAGILNATRCVRSLAAQAIASGARLFEHATVQAIEPGTRTSVVRFNRNGASETVEARSVIIAAGPWAGRLFGDLGIANALHVTQQQVVYYPLEHGSPWSADGRPIYIAHGRDGMYGFPVCERPGFIKVGIELDTPVNNPDVAAPGADQRVLAQLNGIIDKMFRGVRSEPAEVVTCRYTETADRDFIIDRHPEHPGIVVASPCSGHGFKFSILTGKLAVELATSSAGSYTSPLWRDRFALKRPALANPIAPEWRAR